MNLQRAEATRMRSRLRIASSHITDARRALLRRGDVIALALATILLGGAGLVSSAELLSAADVMALTQPESHARIPYGAHTQQFGDLRLPAGAGPHPVVVFLHGGCWLARYDLEHAGRMLAALADHGIASWSVEYRRVGNGGGWPMTFEDVANGVDRLRDLAPRYALDLDRVILAGHSAGGHLALWAAARPNLRKAGRLSSVNPLRVRGVLGLAPAPGLAALHKRGVCGQVIDTLMGGSPRQRPDRYRNGDPTEVAPAVPQVLLLGELDAGWRKSGTDYYRAAYLRGDAVRLRTLKGAGHFELIMPGPPAWNDVLAEVRLLLGPESQHMDHLEDRRGPP